MSFLARSLAPRLAQASRSTQPRVAAFSTSVARKAGGGPPIIQGEGAKPGEIPSDESQSTGLERFELLNKLQGVDVFDMSPLPADRLGTKKDPITVQSLVSIVEDVRDGVFHTLDVQRHFTACSTF